MEATVSIERNSVDGVLTCGIAEFLFDSFGSDDNSTYRKTLAESGDSSGISIGGECLVWESSISNTSSTSVQFMVPLNPKSAAVTPSSVYLCLSTPNYYNNPAEGYFYAFNLLTALSYPLTYDPLFASNLTSIGLSTSIPIASGSEAFILPVQSDTNLLTSPPSATIEERCTNLSLPTSTSETSNNHFILTNSTTVLSPVIFPSSGFYVLCLWENDYSSFGYHALQGFITYDTPAVLSPSALVTGLPELVQISGVPANASLFFSSSGDCDNVPADKKLFSAVANDEGLANANITPTITITESAGGTLTLCVAYLKETNGISSTIYLPAGVLNVTSPTLYPHFAVTAEANTITVKVGDPKVLEKGMVYILPLNEVPAATESCSSSVPSAAVFSGSFQTSTSEAFFLPSFDFNPPSADVVYQVCISGGNETFVSAGNIVSVASPSVKLNPSPFPTLNLPINGTVIGSSFLDVVQPDVYAVIGVVPSSSESFSIAPSKSSIRNPCNNFTEYPIYQRGNISSETGEITPFELAPSSSSSPEAVMEAILCVANESSLLTPATGYFYVGNISAYAFTALSHYAVVNAFNSIISWPPLNSSNVVKYLTPCPGSGCSGTNVGATMIASTHACRTGPQFFTSSILGLIGAEPGEYYLCEATSDGKVTAANSTMVVISPATWSLTVSPLPIRQYRPFTVSIQLPGTGTTHCKLIVQSAETPCGQAVGSTESQTFSVEAVSTSLFTSNITITDIQPVANVVFCVEPTPYDSILGTNTTLNYYPSPAVVVAGRSNTITSGGLKSEGVATKIASTPECEDIISTTIEQLKDYKSTLTLDSCGATATIGYGYYCESASGTTFLNRGKLTILHPTGCVGSGAEVEDGGNKGKDGGVNASIEEVVAVPGAPIKNTGIISGVLENPLLSKTSDCISTLPSTVISVGYTPEFNEAALFFVCATIVGDPSVVFTTASPTLKIVNWAVSPTSALSRYSSFVGVQESTILRINYRTSTSQTIFSSSDTCATSIGSAASMSTASLSATFSTVADHGLTFVCTTNIGDTGAMTPISTFLTVSTPTVANASLAIMNGATYTAVLIVDSYNGNAPFYSMQAGKDENYTYASYYVTDNRDVFLSSDSCKTVLDGTTKTSVTTSNAVFIPTNELNGILKNVYLCTGTPAGVGVAAVVPFTTSSVYPTTFFTGVSSRIYGPLFPSSTVSLSAGESTCSHVIPTIPSFTLDSFGFGTITLKYTTTDTAVTIGAYTLCNGNQNGSPIASIQVIEMLLYSIRGEVFIVGVPSIVELQGNLTTAVLSSGFSASQDCEITTTEYGSWSQVSSTSIEVTAVKAISELYLCAKVEANNTVISVPSYPSYLSFFSGDENVKLPPGGLTTCGSNDITRCGAPGASTSSSDDRVIIGLIYGDCCNSADKANVLGSTTANEDGICRLSLNEEIIHEYYQSGSTFTLCAWDSQDESYCATLADSINVSMSCAADAIGKSKRMSTGWMVLIIVVCVVVSLLIAVLVFLLWYCYFRKRSMKEKQKRLVAVRQTEGKELSGSVSLSHSEEQFVLPVPARNPLLYYAAVAAPPLTPSMSWAPCTSQGGITAVGESENSLSWEEKQKSKLFQEKEEIQEKGRGAGKEDIEPIQFEEDTNSEGGDNHFCDAGDRLLDERQKESLCVAYSVQRVEDDTRDQIALEEAKNRYYLSLEWREKLERQRLKEKEEEVELGYEDDKHGIDEVKPSSCSPAPTMGWGTKPIIPSSFPSSFGGPEATNRLNGQLFGGKDPLSWIGKDKNVESSMEELGYRLVSIEREEEGKGLRVSSECSSVMDMDTLKEHSSRSRGGGEGPSCETPQNLSEERENALPLPQDTILPRKLIGPLTADTDERVPHGRRHRHHRRCNADDFLISSKIEKKLEDIPLSFNVLPNLATVPAGKTEVPHDQRLKSTSESVAMMKPSEKLTEVAQQFSLPQSKAISDDNDEEEAHADSGDLSQSQRDGSLFQYCDPTSSGDICKGSSPSFSPLCSASNKTSLEKRSISFNGNSPHDSRRDHSFSHFHLHSEFHFAQEFAKVKNLHEVEENTVASLKEHANEQDCYSIASIANANPNSALGGEGCEQPGNGEDEKMFCRGSSESYKGKESEVEMLKGLRELTKAFEEQGASSLGNLENSSEPRCRNSLFGLVDIIKEKSLLRELEKTEDAMSYTITQRYYDETRVLKEEEAARRQRWRNCEEEERGLLVQHALEDYMILSGQN